MGIETKAKEIDNVLYEVTQFTATRGFKLSARLWLLFSEPLANLFSSGNIDKSKSFLDMDASVIAKAIASLNTKFTDESLFEFAKELLTQTQRDRKEINFDLDFAGNIMHLYKVLVFVVEVNFADFFDGLRSGWEKLKPAFNEEMSKHFQSQNTSTGES